MNFVNIQFYYKESQSNNVENRSTRTKETDDENHEKTLCMIIAEIEIHRFKILVIVVLNESLSLVLFSPKVLFETSNTQEERMRLNSL